MMRARTSFLLLVPVTLGLACDRPAPPDSHDTRPLKTSFEATAAAADLVFVGRVREIPPERQLVNGDGYQRLRMEPTREIRMRPRGRDPLVTIVLLEGPNGLGRLRGSDVGRMLLVIARERELTDESATRSRRAFVASPEATYVQVDVRGERWGVRLLSIVRDQAAGYEQLIADLRAGRRLARVEALAFDQLVARAENPARYEDDQLRDRAPRPEY